LKVRIEIGELVLHGFKSGSDHLLELAIKRELSHLIRQNGLPEAWKNSTSNRHQIHDARASFSVSENRDPKKIGTLVSRSIYNNYNAKERQIDK
jgi:hypothetical protein